jgi:hypothetical protein
MRRSEFFDILLKIFMILFGVFLIYQLVRLIFGGSWSVENLNAALLVLFITMMFSFAKKLEVVATDVKHLGRSFASLAADFKAHRNNCESHMWKYHKKR